MIIMENVNIQEEIYVGIDLGTTNTLACWMNKGKPSLFKFKGSRNKSMLPSVLYVEEDGSVMVGQDAKQAMILDPDNGVRSSKTYIGKFGGREDKYKNPYVCHGRKFNPTEVAAEVLSTVKKTIIKKAKCDDDAVIKAVITVPAYFNQNQKDETRKAGEMAGLQVLRVLVEPTAAALAAVKEIDIDGKVLVVDLGGGTFDLSLLQVDNINNSYTAIDVDGNERLGGDDFNRVIYEYFVEELQKEYGIDLTSFNRSGLDKNEYNSCIGRLMEAAEDCKIELSEQRITSVNLPNLFSYKGSQKGLMLEMTRDKFNELCDELYEIVFDKIKSFVKRQPGGIGSISKIILAGGSCEIPYIQETLEAYMKKNVEGVEDKSVLVVTGACYLAESLKGGMVGSDTKIEDILSHSFGIEIVEDNKDVLSKILYKGDKYPCSKQEKYTTCSDYQESIKINVYEAASDCEDKKDIKLHNLYGSFSLDGIQRAKACVPSIIVTFDFDENAHLTVTATDEKTGVSKTVHLEKGVTLDSKPKQRPIDFMVMLDTSYSMVSDIDEAKSACKYLVNNLVDLTIHRIGLVSFESQARLECNLTSDKAKLGKIIDGLGIGCATNLYDALVIANNAFLSNDKKRVIIVVTDGMPMHEIKVSDYAKRLRDMGIEIIAIGIGNDCKKDYLRKIAEGNVYGINTIAELRETFKAAVEKLTKA